jgi:glucan phosphoethanolaminetransferase (alkaline phosphatase superfamily)
VVYLKTQIPFPKKRSLWPLLIAPLMMAGSYIAICYPRFCPDASFIWEHFYILTIWLSTTVVLMFLAREFLIHFHLRLIFIPTVIIPTLSCFALYFIYTCALLGNFTWGVLPSYDLVFLNLSHLFELADNFEIPHFFVVTLFLFPLMGFSLIFYGQAPKMILCHWSVRENFLGIHWRKRLSITIGLVLIWLFFLGSIVIADPSLHRFGNFSDDPVVNFFKKRRDFFPMTPERVLAIQKDRHFEKFMRPKLPSVHNIILIVVDALRADHLPVYGYTRPLTPNLSGFLSHVPYQKVDLTLSNGFDTLTGLQCLMTSKEPWAVSQFNYTLADFLSDNGFKNYFTLAGNHSWQKRRHSFGKRIDFFYDGSENPTANGDCDDEIAINGLEKLKPDDGSYHFIYIHLISVHQLSLLHPDFEFYTPIHNILNLVFLGSQVSADILSTTNMYDDRILQMDDSLGKALSILKQKGYLHDYVGVFTADHGQLLGEKGRYGHGFFATLGGMRVPLIFFGSKPLPRLAQKHFATQVDIAQTLADLAGLELVSCWQGQSLLRPRVNPWSIHYSVQAWEGREEAAVYSGEGKILKYSRTIGGNSGKPLESLYDLEKDPLENENLIGHYNTKFTDQIRHQADEYFSKY